jgi:hypothetical protein
MQALIDPTTTNIQYIASWTAPVAPSILYTPVYATYANSTRVCQVEPDASVFPVAEPLFWTSCPDNCVANQWYYDTSSNSCDQIVNAPYPG